MTLFLTIFFSFFFLVFSFFSIICLCIFNSIQFSSACLKLSHLFVVFNSLHSFNHKKIKFPLLVYTNCNQLHTTRFMCFLYWIPLSRSKVNCFLWCCMSRNRIWNNIFSIARHVCFCGVKVVQPAVHFTGFPFYSDTMDEWMISSKVVWQLSITCPGCQLLKHFCSSILLPFHCWKETTAVVER